jgi:hypothetical protein
MTDDEARMGVRLLERLVAAEPPTTVDATALRIRASARLRRRRWVSTGAAVAVVGCISAAGWMLGPTVGHRSAPVADGPAPFSPDALVAALRSSISGAQALDGTATTTWRLQEVRAQVGSPTRILTGAERAEADRWQARFTDGADHVVDVVLMWEKPRPLDGARSDCDAGIAAELYDSCRAGTTSAGVPSEYLERAGYPIDDSWPTPNDPQLVKAVPAADRWYLHQLELFNPSGLTVVVTEVVHTASRADAATLWTLTPAALTQIASDPALTYPRPATSG